MPPVIPLKAVRRPLQRSSVRDADLAWFWLITRYPASQLASFSFLTPIFGVVAGAVLLDEPIGIELAGAVALIAAGIYLVNRPAT